jgi:hypothetical protein
VFRKQEKIQMADAATIEKPGKLKSKYKGWIGKLLINNQWVPAVGGKTFDVIDPATEEVVCKVASADREGRRSGGQGRTRRFREP